MGVDTKELNRGGANNKGNGPFVATRTESVRVYKFPSIYNIFRCSRSCSKPE